MIEEEEDEEVCEFDESDWEYPHEDDIEEYPEEHSDLYKALISDD